MIYNFVYIYFLVGTTHLLMTSVPLYTWHFELYIVVSECIILGYATMATISSLEHVVTINIDPLWKLNEISVMSNVINLLAHWFSVVCMTCKDACVMDHNALKSTDAWKWTGSPPRKINLPHQNLRR